MSYIVINKITLSGASQERIEEVFNFFKGVNGPLTLKKRYRDLLKIFHPDNLCGDMGIVQLINKEYERLKKEFERRR